MYKNANNLIWHSTVAEDFKLNVIILVDFNIGVPTNITW